MACQIVQLKPGELEERVDAATRARNIVHAELKAGRLGQGPADRYEFRYAVGNDKSEAENHETVQKFLAAYRRGDAAFGVGSFGSVWHDLPLDDGTVERVSLDPRMTPPMETAASNGKVGVWTIGLEGNPFA